MGISGIRKGLAGLASARRVAEGMIGIPFRDGGRDASVGGGLDCWGVVLEYYRRRFGVELPDPASLDPDTCEAAPVFRWFEPIPVGHAQEGDVLRFAFGADGEKGRHIGVKIGRDQVLHVSKQSVAIHTIRLFKFDAAFVLVGEPSSDDAGEGME